MSASVIICCGSGGVGKTTSSAALALKLAMDGQRVVVLTIDPARRLADSLNMGAIGGAPTRVPLPDAIGHCDAVTLDVAETFVALIRRFASSEEIAERILINRYFQFASTRLGGVHEYMAAEKVRALAVCGEYDVVVVDTPPSRNALDFLRAPERLAGLMDGAVMRWMAMPATRGGWRALELGSEAAAKVLRRLVGDGTIGEIAQFFELFRDLWDGFHARSIEVQTMLRGPDTRFLLVTSPAPTARSEALFFLDQLKHQKMPFAGFLINRVQQAPAELAKRTAFPSNGPIDDWSELCDQVADIPLQQTRLAKIHQRSIHALLAAEPKVAAHWVIPDQDCPVNDIDALINLGTHLPTARELAL
jgi:anion-transporting  ArsA/GET3 family ATPase